MVDRHRGAPRLEGVDDLAEAVGRRGGRRDLVVAEQTRRSQPVRRERLLGDHAALLEACAAAEHERAPIVEAAGAAAHAETGDVALRQRLRRGAELVEGLRRLQARLLEQVGAVVEVDHDVLQRQVILLAVGALVDLPDVVGDVAAARPGRDHRVDRLERLHRREARRPGQAHHRRVRAIAGDEGREEPRLVVVAAAPRNRLGLDLDAGILLLELGDEGGGRILRIVEMIPPAHRRGLREGGRASGARAAAAASLRTSRRFMVVFLPCRCR